MSATSTVTSAEISASIWASMGSSAPKDIWWTAVGVMLQAMIVAMIINKTFDYYEHFHRTDKLWLQIAIAIGTFLSVQVHFPNIILVEAEANVRGTLGLKLAELYELIYKGETAQQTIMHFIGMSDMTHLLIGTIFGTSTGAYYVYRGYMMSKRAWYFIPIFSFALLCQVSVSLLTVITGFLVPGYSPAKAKLIGAKQQRIDLYYRIWAAVTLGVDGCLCLYMTFVLFNSKQSIFNKKGRLLTRIIATMWEAMLPPVVCLFILVVGTGGKDFSLADWPKVLIFIIPVLYYHAALHTLVGRHTVRTMLDEKLAAEGVHLFSHEKHSGIGSGNSSGGRVYASHSYAGKEQYVEQAEKGEARQAGDYALAEMPVTPKRYLKVQQGHAGYQSEGWATASEGTLHSDQTH